jgi:phosphoserine aminotransferase
MVAVEDALDGLKWAEGVGGLKGLIARTERNFAAIEAWVDRTPWIGFLADEKATRSTTSVCLTFTDPWFKGLSAEQQAAFAKDIAAKLEAEQAAFDIGGYRDAPPGLRIWGGATVERADLEALFPWLDWAFETVRGQFTAAA